MATGMRIVNIDEASVTASDYVDVTFTIPYSSMPIVTATTKVHDINVWVDTITLTGARINFSAKYTGTVYYQVIDKG